LCESIGFKLQFLLRYKICNLSEDNQDEDADSESDRASQRSRGSRASAYSKYSAGSRRNSVNSERRLSIWSGRGDPCEHDPLESVNPIVLKVKCMMS